MGILVISYPFDSQCARDGQAPTLPALTCSSKDQTLTMASKGKREIIERESLPLSSILEREGGCLEMGMRVAEVGVGELVKAGLSMEEAQEFERILKAAVGGARGSDPSEVWREVVARRVLSPSHPHGLHRLVFHSVYAEWDESIRGPPLYWFPSL